MIPLCKMFEVAPVRRERRGRCPGYRVRPDNTAATASDWSSRPQAGGRQRMVTYSGLTQLWQAALVSLVCLSGPSLASQTRGGGGGGPTYTTFHDIPDSQPQFLRALSNYSVRVGHTVTFTCQAKNVKGYKVAWLHSEKGIIAVYPDMVAQNDRFTSTYDNRDSWFLSIDGVEKSDAGKYICQLNTARPISISGTLSVVVPPNIRDETSSGDTLATEGRSVTLNCDATGTPKPTITWRREDGETIRLCAPNYGEEDNCSQVKEYVGDSLTLININRFQSGAYLCIGKNNVPPSVSKRVQLYVDFPPTLWITHQLVGVPLGGVATIECLTAAHPKSLNFWHDKFGQFINQKQDKFLASVSEGSPSYYNSLMRLQIMNVTREDLGKYTCKAKNSLGGTSGEITLYEVEVSTTTSRYGVWDIFGTTESEELDADLDEETKKLRKRKRAKKREKWRKDREDRRMQ